ncbi:MAG: hypothetical protein ABJ263_02820 [Tateyamaria sp.]|uniref:hypothetical protein n=1 Tax=Tateyamaria sp. TaxID=1929288 RepID=UPI003285555D
MSDLDAQLLAAHEAHDVPALVALYRQAAAAADSDDARGFYLTHAHVFALEINHPDATSLRDALIEMGRETEL